MAANQPVSDGYGLNQSLAFSIPFTFGTPFDVAVTMYSDIRLDSHSLDNNGVGYSVTHDAGNTVSWGGTAAVLDNTNAPVNSFSLGSASGTNYLNPIPEPSTITMFLVAGTLACAFAVRRYRKS